jgi:hypothetical protein
VAAKERSMTRAERLLYHQIHPLKLLTDVTTSFASSWLLWQAQWWWAAAVAWLPSLLMTAALVGSANLEPYRDSEIGHYAARFMTQRRITALRFGGQAIMWAGAAAQIPWLLPAGFMVVVYAWLNGLWAPASSSSPQHRNDRAPPESAPGFDRPTSPVR